MEDQNSEILVRSDEELFALARAKEEILNLRKQLDGSGSGAKMLDISALSIESVLSLGIGGALSCLCELDIFGLKGDKALVVIRQLRKSTGEDIKNIVEVSFASYKFAQHGMLKGDLNAAA